MNQNTLGRALEVMIVCLLASLPAAAQTRNARFALDSAEDLQPVNVRVEATTYEGRACVRVIEPLAEPAGSEVKLALVKGAELADGVIQVMLSGAPVESAPAAARGFVGVAFRVAPSASAFECIYLRPTNARASDQLRRNHSVQYFSYPDWPWYRLRKETPGVYETYVDLVGGRWTKVRIEVAGARAQLFVDDATQPTLLVSDLKLPPRAGGVGLWIGPGTVAHFADLELVADHEQR